MKKLVPFLFPIMALTIVFVVALRWYNSQATQPGQLLDTAADTQVEPATDSVVTQLIKSAKDAKSIELAGDSQARGQVRYEVKNGQLIFSVIADLPPLSKGESYQVWLVPGSSSVPQKAFLLTSGKGGFMGSGTVSVNILPVTVEVTLEKNERGQAKLLLLKGILPKN